MIWSSKMTLIQMDTRSGSSIELAMLAKDKK